MGQIGLDDLLLYEHKPLLSASTINLYPIIHESFEGETSRGERYQRKESILIFFNLPYLPFVFFFSNVVLQVLVSCMT